MKPTLTIGIAAYNEEKNIGNLLRAILTQEIPSAELREIIVVSDASIDATDSIVSEINDIRIRLISNDMRFGLNKNQNIIAEQATGDILVVLDADIIPENNQTIETLIKPMVENENIALLSAKMIPIESKTFIEKVLAKNHEFKNWLFESLPLPNVYVCFGPARAFSRTLYTKLRYPDDCPVDAYSYFYARNNGFTFMYNPESIFIFRCAATIQDHAKQSTRFQASKRAMEDLFGADYVKKEYTIPKKKLIQYSLRELLVHPIVFIAYVITNFIVKKRYKVKSFNSRWDMAISSKHI